MTHLIQATALCKKFGQKTVLDQLDFTLQAGEPIALIGPNGAGKTTLFSLLCGYLTPSSGQIKILGHTPGSSSLFGRVSALPQDAQLDPNFSVQTQLEFYCRLQGMNKNTAKTETARVLALVDLAQNGQQKATALSHGMRKRVAIAQALLGQPELVLLDEPTAGLDPVNAMQVRKLIAQLSGEATFVVSSHNIFELERLCGTVLYLENGRLQQQQPTHQQGKVGYLALQLEQADNHKVLALLTQLPGVQKVEPLQKNEYGVVYDPELCPDMDLTVLAMLRNEGLAYRQLTLGRSLEQQLFSVVNG